VDDVIQDEVDIINWKTDLDLKPGKEFLEWIFVHMYVYAILLKNKN
jgi:hypothetical protein